MSYFPKPLNNFFLAEFDAHNECWVVCRSFQSSCFEEAELQCTGYTAGVREDTQWILVDTETGNARKIYSEVERHVNVRVV